MGKKRSLKKLAKKLGRNPSLPQLELLRAQGAIEAYTTNPTRVQPTAAPWEWLELRDGDWHLIRGG